MIRKLMLAGADAFRINMSHGDQKQKAKLVEQIRALEKEFHRPTTILFDLQGPKLRVGHFEGGRTVLEKGQRFIFDRDDKAGRQQRASSCRTPSCSRRSSRARSILIDDGKVRLNVLEADADRIVSEVEGRRRGLGQQGRQRPRRGGADPGADREGPRRPRSSRSSSGRDWIALSFVQRPEDVAEARPLIGDRAALLAKIEKPAAIDRLERHHRACRRGDGRARRPRRRASARAGAAAAEEDRRQRAPVRQAGGRRDADARIDDHLADADPRRGQRRRDRDLRRRRCGHALGRKRGRPISGRSGADDGPDRQQRRARSRATRRAIHFTQTRLEPTTADALAGSARQIAQHRLGDGDGLLHQLRLDRAAHRARAAAGAAAGAERVAAHRAAARPAVGRARGAHARRVELRGDGREGQAHGAAPPDREGRRPDRS